MAEMDADIGALAGEYKSRQGKRAYESKRLGTFRFPCHSRSW
jgi:hypothetical protein